MNNLKTQHLIKIIRVKVRFNGKGCTSILALQNLIYIKLHYDNDTN